MNGEPVRDAAVPHAAKQRDRIAALDVAPASDIPSSIPLICALLRGEVPRWPSEIQSDDLAAFLAAARYHGVTPLLDREFVSRPELGSWPDPIRRACHVDAIEHAKRELATRAEMSRILAVLGSAGIASLLMKGAALAYSHYPSPALRPRADCDLLVAPLDRQAAFRFLQDLGYRRVNGPAGTFVGYQLELHYDDPRGIKHTIDVHWHISNAQTFAWLFTFEDLCATSESVPQISSNAVRLGNLQALMLVLLHRAGDNQFVGSSFGDRLIWLYDLKLLVEEMSDVELHHFCRLAEEKRVVAIAIEGLRSCADCLGSTRVETLLRELERSPRAQSGARFLSAGKLVLEWLELRAIPTSSGRLTYLANRLFPCAEYMRERFPDSASRALPVLHARRWLGLGRRLSARRR